MQRPRKPYQGTTHAWHGLFSSDGQFLVVRASPPIGVDPSWVHVVVNAPSTWRERKVRNFLRAAWSEGHDDAKRALRAVGGCLTSAALILAGKDGAR